MGGRMKKIVDLEMRGQVLTFDMMLQDWQGECQEGQTNRNAGSGLDI